LLPDRKELPLLLPQFLQRGLKKREIMHYYQFSIGDYRAATAHLTNEEDLAYRRLLDMYYDTEQKIPLDTQWVSRRLRVDAHVVKDVLNDMFVQHEDGWYHARCADVIEQYHAMAEKNRANGRLGGRKKNPVGSDSQPIAKATINQEPITNNHKPKKETAIAVCPINVEEAVWADFLALRKAKKAPVTVTALAGIKREADKANWSLARAITECVERGWTGFKAEWVAPKPTFAQQAADVARTTVPAQHSGPDPVLLKIAADREKATPMPEHIRQQINQVLRKA
jgi:uncharacterized protein YdaU (DUF1376 family)